MVLKHRNMWSFLLSKLKDLFKAKILPFIIGSVWIFLHEIVLSYYTEKKAYGDEMYGLLSIKGHWTIKISEALKIQIRGGWFISS